MRTSKKFRELTGAPSSSPREQEEHAARIIGGRRHRGSGASQYLKGDSSSGSTDPFDGFLVECKQTEHDSFQSKLNVKVLAKLIREAMAVEKRPMLHLELLGEVPSLCDRRWVMLPERVFRALFGDE